MILKRVSLVLACVWLASCTGSRPRWQGNHLRIEKNMKKAEGMNIGRRLLHEGRGVNRCSRDEERPRGRVDCRTDPDCVHETKSGSLSCHECLLSLQNHGNPDLRKMISDAMVDAATAWCTFTVADAFPKVATVGTRSAFTLM
jgi:hypothetical protein